MFLKTIRKRDDCIIKVETGVHKGANYVELREWFQPEDSENWHPTKRGIRMNGQQFGAFAKAIKEGEAQILADLMAPIPQEEIGSAT